MPVDSTPIKSMHYDLFVSTENDLDLFITDMASNLLTYFTVYKYRDAFSYARSSSSHNNPFFGWESAKLYEDIIRYLSISVNLQFPDTL